MDSCDISRGLGVVSQTRHIGTSKLPQNKRLKSCTTSELGRRVAEKSLIGEETGLANTRLFVSLFLSLHTLGCGGQGAYYAANEIHRAGGKVEFDGQQKIRLVRFSNLDIGDSQLASARGLEYLEELHLERTKISDRGLQKLGSLPMLRVISLYSTQITDDGVEHLVQFPKLQVVGLNYTGIGDAALPHIAKLREIEVLWLDRTKITDEGVQHLEKLNGLKELGIRDTGVTAQGVKALQHALVNTRIYHDSLGDLLPD